MVSELGGLEFESQSHISLHVIIHVDRSPYDEAHIAQTSGINGGVLADTQ
jgi:hypothetical protein